MVISAINEPFHSVKLQNEILISKQLANVNVLHIKIVICHLFGRKWINVEFKWAHFLLKRYYETSVTRLKTKNVRLYKQQKK